MANKIEKIEQEKKNAVGRPKKEINWETVKPMCYMHATQEQIADYHGVSVDTLTRREEFCGIQKEYRARGKMSLMNWMWKSAEGGNVTMQIWLSKNILGYCDRVVTSEETKMEGTLDKLADVLNTMKQNGE